MGLAYEYKRYKCSYIWPKFVIFIIANGAAKARKREEEKMKDQNFESKEEDARCRCDRVRSVLGAGSHPVYMLG